MIVVVKAAGVLSQKDASGDPDLVSLLAKECRCKIYPVHRLDRGVGGVMVFAKTQRAAASLSGAVSDAESFSKEYLAVASGIPAEPSGELCDYLLHDERRRRTSVVPLGTPGAKNARLAYRMLETAKDGVKELSLLAVRLYTGRTHQIRAQLSFHRLPLAGDGRYGARDRYPGIALFAAKLSFRHPDSGKMLSYSAETPDSPPFHLFQIRTL